MTEILVGSALVSTNDQDLTAQKNSFLTPGVFFEGTMADHFITGMSRAQLSLCEANVVLQLRATTRTGWLEVASSWARLLPSKS